MFSFDPIKIAVEKAGIPIKAKEDESVSERFKEWFNRGFECLVWLRIMIHDERLFSN
jgi:hypothetical protein